MNLPTEKQASLLRRYIMEYVIFCLTIAVIFLFIQYQNLNSFVIEKFIPVIEKNTSVIQNIKNN
jgi:uncharacterized membrane protein YwzB